MTKASGQFQFAQPATDARAQVKSTVARQGLLSNIGTQVISVEPGVVELALPFSDKVDQQHGFFHGGAVAAIADVASGSAGISLLEKGGGVLTTDLSLSFIAPGKGERIIGIGRVRKFGKRLIFGHSDVFAETGGDRTLVATALVTLMRIHPDHNQEKDHVGE